MENITENKTFEEMLKLLNERELYNYNELMETIKKRSIEDDILDTFTEYRDSIGCETLRHIILLRDFSYFPSGIKSLLFDPKTKKLRNSCE